MTGNDWYSPLVLAVAGIVLAMTFGLGVIMGRQEAREECGEAARSVRANCWSPPQGFICVETGGGRKK